MEYYNISWIGYICKLLGEFTQVLLWKKCYADDDEYVHATLPILLRSGSSLDKAGPLYNV